MKLITSLEEVLDHTWRNLSEGVGKKGHPFHYPVISTISRDKPLQRTIVLRSLFVTGRTLLLHTDTRSRKVSDLRVNPRMSWLFYDHSTRVQLHFESRCELHEPGSELNENEWNKLVPGERRIYCVKHAPGTPILEPHQAWPDEILSKPLSEDDVAAGKKNFCVITAELIKLDWLQLHPEGEYRAHFHWKDDEWTGSWVSL